MGDIVRKSGSSSFSNDSSFTLSHLYMYTNAKCLTSVKQMYNFKSASTNNNHTHTHTVFCAVFVYAQYPLSRRETESERKRTRLKHHNLTVIYQYLTHLISSHTTYISFMLSRCVCTHITFYFQAYIAYKQFVANKNVIFSIWMICLKTDLHFLEC